MQLSKYRLSFFSISGLVIIIGFIFIILGGLNPGIDFTGGSTLTVKIPNVDSSSEVRNSLSNTQYDNSIIQNFGNNTFFIRTVMIDDDQKKNILQNLDSITPDKDVEILSFDLISPLIANETVVHHTVALGSLEEEAAEANEPPGWYLVFHMHVPMAIISHVNHLGQPGGQFFGQQSNGVGGDFKE